MKKNSPVGKTIACRDCGGQAIIQLEEGRYIVWCYQEQKSYLLKNQHCTESFESIKEIMAREGLVIV